MRTCCSHPVQYTHTWWGIIGNCIQFQRCVRATREVASNIISHLFEHTASSAWRKAVLLLRLPLCVCEAVRTNTQSSIRRVGHVLRDVITSARWVWLKATEHAHFLPKTNRHWTGSLPASMDVLSEAPSCDPEVIQPRLLGAREFVSPASPTLAQPVDCEPRPTAVADVASVSSEQLFTSREGVVFRVHVRDMPCRIDIELEGY